MAKLNYKTANRAAIHNSQQGVLVNRFGDIAKCLPTQTENLLRSGYTPYHGRKNILKELGIRQILASSPGMRDLYTLNYDAEYGTGYICKLSEEANGLSGFVDLLEAKNNYKTHVYCDTSITGNCLFSAFYNRPQNKGSL